jgi:tRNA pseudouridine13 synthase
MAHKRALVGSRSWNNSIYFRDKRFSGNHQVEVSETNSKLNQTERQSSSRYSDFHVNEIDLEGNEAVLSDFTLPELPEEVVDSKNYKEDLKEFIDDEQIVKIQEMIDSKDEDNSKHITIDVTDYDKDKRAKLHKTLKAVYGKHIFNNTVSEDEKKLIQIRKSTKRDQQRALGWLWPHENTCFILHKENIDTLQAIAALSHKLSMKPALFSYAGTKDKRAKTSQWISVKKIEPLKICHAAKKCQGVRVGNFKKRRRR